MKNKKPTPKEKPVKRRAAKNSRYGSSMTKADALREFNLDYPKSRWRSDGMTDYPAWRQAWHFYIDDLHRRGRITDKQVNSWGNPPGSEGTRKRRR